MIWSSFDRPGLKVFLIWSKTLDFEKSVTLTFRLPFIRSSVDHGTAFDIAGKGIAGSIIVTFFMTISIGSKTEIATIIKSGASGIVLGLISAATAVIFFFVFNLLLPKKKSNNIIIPQKGGCHLLAAVFLLWKNINLISGMSDEFNWVQRGIDWFNNDKYNWI